MLMALKIKRVYAYRATPLFYLRIGIEVVFAIFFFSCFSGVLPKLYTAMSKCWALPPTMLFFAAVFQISDGMQAVAAGALRGMQDVKYPASYRLCFLLVDHDSELLFPHLTFRLRPKRNLDWLYHWLNGSVSITIDARFKYVLKKLEFEK
jgi:MATE family multidrug resistance protein